MKRFDTELAAGLFVLVGIGCLAYLSIRLARMEVLGHRGYEIEAVFTDVGGLKAGAPVVIAGVEVGRVRHVALIDYNASVVLSLDDSVKVQTDAIASIKTRGLIGEKYVEISPGGDEEIVAPAGRIKQTEPAVDLESLISNFIFGKVD